MAECDEYVSRYSVCKNCNNEVVDCGREKCPVYKAPTAEVVPKSEVDILKSLITYKEEEAYNKGYEDGKADMQSEVEKLQNELVIWKQNRFNLFQRLECYEMAKRKVASEIFAEIETLLALNILVGDVFTGKYFDADLENDIAELKKKYTEGDQ